MTHIGFDIDGVLADFATAYIGLINTKKGTTFTVEDIRRHEFWDTLPITREEAFVYVHELLTHCHDNILPFPEMQVFVPTLTKDHTLSVITSRPEIFAEKTHRFIQTHFPSCFSGIYYSSDAYTPHGGKGHYCREKSVELFVEDCSLYANAVAAEGIPVALIDRPWNRYDLLLPLVHRTSLTDLEQTITTLLKGKQH